MLAAAVAVAIGTGFYIRYNQTDRHVLPSMNFSANPRVQNSHLASIHDHSVLGAVESFKNKDGLIIKTFSRFPKSGEPKAHVFIVHGFAEHSGRYAHVVRELLELDIAVHALDHQGHGQSEGERAYVRKFEDFAEDLLKFVKYVNRNYKIFTKPKKSSVPCKEGEKRFLIGHSMGGLISILAASMEPEKFDAVILSSPWLRLDKQTNSRKPFLIPILRIVSQLFPKLVISPGLSPDGISKDADIVANYLNDPLVCEYIGVRARLIVEGDRVQTELWESCYSKIQMPLLIMQASDDLLVDPDGAREIHKLAPSKDKTLKIFEGYRHEIFNEPEKDENGKNPPIQYMKSWIQSKL